MRIGVGLSIPELATRRRQFSPTSSFAVKSASGTSYSAARNVLSSGGTSYSVSATVLSSNGTAYSPI